MSNANNTIRKTISDSLIAAGFTLVADPSGRTIVRKGPQLIHIKDSGDILVFTDGFEGHTKLAADFVPTFISLNA